MKHKILSFLTAFAMVFGILAAPFTNASAAEATETESVTIHKILLTKEALEAHDKNKKYDGNAIADIKDFFGDQSAKEIDGVYFKLQKLNAGVAEGDIDVNNDAQWTDITEGENAKAPFKYKGLTENGAGLKLDTKGLGKGTYRIVEDLKQSKYKGDDGELLAASKAVPTLLVLPVVNDKEGIVKDAHVYPKNTQEKPEIDKNFGANNDLTTVKDEQGNQKSGAAYENYAKEKATVTADLGKQIPYEVKTKIKKDSKYQKLVWNDNMTKGLTYQKDLKVEGAGLTAEDYFVTETDRGFTLVLKDSGLTKVETAAKAGDVEITLTYSAKINGKAVVDKPELNDIALDYANKKGHDSEPKEFTPGKKEIKMKKSWDVTGDQTVTEADKGVTAYFTLQKKNAEGKWEDVETVEKTEKDNFEVTFSNLDENGTYRIVESVKGYEAEYMEYNEATGEIEIKDHKDTDNPEKLNPTEPKVQLGGRKFVKTNNEDKGSDKLERLAGAEFYVKNAEGKYLVAAKKDAQAVTDAKAALDEAVKAYNDLSAEDQKGQKGTEAKTLINQKQEAYNKAFVDNATSYTWGEKTDPNVVVLTSDAEGRFEISGLEYKAGYELEEKTAPKGYAKLQSNEKFEVKDGSYASTDAELQYNKDNADKGYGLQIKNKNVVIPQTGGIGSIIFVVAGLMIMGLAAYKMKANKEQA
ncbi:MAG: pilin N-terminal domain-containing protein [Anaerococcus vaginalis]|uniref:pilin N-terminal domain-containing protein n=1 Tax=Anaerococcus vaginalis TaxID=33037 RepID=UPI00290A4A50|nr:pilin N-terminal domain-containing protein [Anaerococcus vaginalis]MDU5086256.1 pilin N-terminal domain-containing protein [Anaerococcus vaginalis]